MNVNEYMAKSGIPVHLKGFEATKRAIELSIEKPDIGCMEIYNIVAKEYGITSYAVERRIRFAVNQGFRNMDEELRNIIFKNEDHVTRIHYIKNVAYAITHNLI